MTFSDKNILSNISEWVKLTSIKSQIGSNKYSTSLFHYKLKFIKNKNTCMSTISVCDLTGFKMLLPADEANTNTKTHELLWLHFENAYFCTWRIIQKDNLTLNVLLKTRCTTHLRYWMNQTLMRLTLPKHPRSTPVIWLGLCSLVFSFLCCVLCVLCVICLFVFFWCCQFVFSTYEFSSPLVSFVSLSRN